MGHIFYKSRLIQEDMYNPQPSSGISSIAKTGAALLGVGAAGALAHAGTFGTGAKNFVDGAASAGSAMAQTAGHKVGESLNDASKFYGGNGTSTPTAIPGTPKHETEQNTHTDSNHYNGIVDHTQNDDDDEGGFGMGALAGAAGLGAAALGIKGISAFGKSDAMRNYKMGAAGHKSNASGHQGLFRSAGLAKHNFNNRVGAAYRGFKTGK